MEEEYQGNWQGCIRHCKDCQHFNREGYAEDRFGSCSMINKIYSDYDLKISEGNNICKYFETKDYLKFRITDKIDTKDGVWRYEDYIDFLKNEWYKDTSPIYFEYNDDQVLPSLQHDFVKYLPLKDGTFVKVQKVYKDAITMKFNYVKANDKTYYIFFHDYMDLEFIKDGKIKYGGKRWIEGVRKCRGGYEIGEEELK